MKPLKTFAALVRSPTAVRNAFRGQGIFQLWWTFILQLHGKPLQIELTCTERRTVIAKGFQFYATLYECLAVLLIGIGVWITFLRLEHSGYWFGLLGLGGGYLLLTCRLGRSGTADYLSGRSSGAISLIVFIMLLVLFLAAFFSVCSVLIELADICPAPVNLFVLAILSTLGIGSYALELVYLLTTKETSP